MTTTKKPAGPRRILNLATHDHQHVGLTQVGNYLGVDWRTVRKWVDAGLFGSVIRLPSGTLRIPLTGVRRFMERQHLAKTDGKTGTAG